MPKSYRNLHRRLYPCRCCLAAPATAAPSKRVMGVRGIHTLAESRSLGERVSLAEAGGPSGLLVLDGSAAYRQLFAPCAAAAHHHPRATRLCAVHAQAAASRPVRARRAQRKPHERLRSRFPQGAAARWALRRRRRATACCVRRRAPCRAFVRHTRRTAPRRRVGAPASGVVPDSKLSTWLRRRRSEVKAIAALNTARRRRRRRRHKSLAQSRHSAQTTRRIHPCVGS